MPTVSVILPNYNHSRFLKKRIDSIINQSFQDFEIIILDDCSTDCSREIIEEYRSNVNITNIVYNQTNSGSTFRQWKKGIQLAKGKYIWFAESDDYWTDPYKLQKQVDFLEKNEDYSLSFHKINILNKNGLITNDFITNVPREYERFENLASQNYIHTPSVVFRSKYLPLPAKLSNAPVGDYVLWLHLASHGKN